MTMTQQIQKRDVTASDVGAAVTHSELGTGKITHANAAGVWCDFGQGEQRINAARLEWAIDGKTEIEKL